MSVMQSNMKFINSQQELINILGEKHPYLILKGTSACSYYNKPILRALGDVDFLIEPKQQSEIEKLLMMTNFFTFRNPQKAWKLTLIEKNI